MFNGLYSAFFVAGVVPGVGTLRIPAACQKVSVLADLDAQRFAALGTIQVGRHAHPLDAEHAVGGRFQIFFKWPVETSQHFQQVNFFGFDLIQILFHFGSKLDIEYFREILYQKIVDDKAQFIRPEIAFNQVHISFAPDGGQNGRIGTGPSNPVFFKLFYQGCFRKPRRRHGKMLPGFQLVEF